ncbi:MAG: hypothetical protein SangKO_027840 [Sandaracinaceae bacterium]
MNVSHCTATGSVRDCGPSLYLFTVDVDADPDEATGLVGVARSLRATVASGSITTSIERKRPANSPGGIGIPTTGSARSRGSSPTPTAPTLLIIGTRDRTALGKGRVSAEVRETLGRYDRLGRAARDAIPNASLVELEGVGHIPQVEAYDDYIGALTRFLDAE